MARMPAGWATRKARIAQEQWNLTHPDRLLPWEWVEEMLFAWRQKEEHGHDPDRCREWWLRYEEFARFVPDPVRAEIFGGL